MKKILFILLICLLLCGCNKKVKCEINECVRGIYPKESIDDSKNHKTIYDVLGVSGCYLFKEHNDFKDFLNEHDLLINQKIESKYSEDFFEDKSLIIYFGMDPNPGYKYKFYLYNEDNILRLEINKSINKKYKYPAVEVDRMFFIDINKEEIVNTTEFVFSTNISK